jgi:hypothetical protein
MNQKLTLAGVLAAVLIGGLFSPSQADQAGQVIYACTTPKNATVMRVSTSPVACPAGTTPIQWGAGSIGPKGDKGDQGDTGLPGLQGPKGDKGDPGYSYEEALASANVQESNVFTFWSGYTKHSDGQFCTGPGFSRIYFGGGWTWGCQKQLDNVKSVNVLSVTAAYSGNQNPDAQLLYLIPGTCSNSLGSATAMLVSGEEPFQIEATNPHSCLVTSFNNSMSYAVGMYQVVVSITPAE